MSLLFPRPSSAARAGARRAFTLIELLVVIAIIAVVASLLMPVMNRAKATSEETKCYSNLRQIGSGLMLFAGENDGCLPAGSISKEVAGTGGDIMWSKQLGPYLPQLTSSVTARENAVFVCPAARYKGYTNATTSRTYHCSAALFYFDTATSGGVAQDPPARRKLAGLANASNTIIVGEGKIAANATSGACSSAISWTLANADILKTSLKETTNLDFRHAEKMNVLYGDGHVGNIPFAKRATAITKVIWEGRTTN